MTTLLLAFLAAHQAPTTVTYLEPAAPLSRSFARSLEASAPTARRCPQHAKSDVVCIVVHDVAPSELLKKLAWATVGEWQAQKDGTQVLVPSDKGRKLQATEELKRRADLITLYVNTNHPASQQFDVKQILKALDPMTLAAIPEGERLVFSSRPNRLQAPFPTDVSQMVFDSIAKSKPRSALSPTGNGETIPPPDPRKVAKVNLAVTLTNIHDELVVGGTLGLYDQDGKDITGPAFSTFGVITAPDTSPDSSKKVSFSPESIRFAKFIAGETEGLDVLELFQFRLPPKIVSALPAAERNDIESQLLDPQRFEPLTYPADLLRSLSTVTDDQIVACLPDSFIGTLPLVFSGDSTVKKLSKALSQNRDIDMHSGSGWLTARPRNPAQAEAVRLDRHRLAQAVKMLHSRDYIRFEDEQQLAQCGYGRHPSSLIDVWSVLARPAYAAESTRIDWEMLRLFSARCSPSRRQQLLRSGQTVRLELIEGSLSALINRIVYGAEGMMHYDRVTNAPAPEPTEVTPNPFLTLKLATEVGPIVMTATENASEIGRLLGAEPKPEAELVNFAGVMAGAKGSPRGAFTHEPFYRSVPSQLRGGTRKSLTLSPLIRLKRPHHGAGSFTDDVMAVNTASISFAELRAKYQQLYDDAAALTARQVQTINAARQGGPVKP